MSSLRPGVGESNLSLDHRESAPANARAALSNRHLSAQQTPRMERRTKTSARFLGRLRAFGTRRRHQVLSRTFGRSMPQRSQDSW